MKQRSIFGIVMLVLLTGGCNDYTVKTTINPDGSFKRTVLCEGDSLGIYQIPLPFNLSSKEWKVDIRRKADGDKRFLATATKTYAALEDQQREFAGGLDSTKLKISTRIEKRFRWFFTYYVYEERIAAYGLFAQTIPIESAFTPRELAQQGDTKDTLLNKRFDEYWERNIVEEFLGQLIARSRELGDTALSASRWEEKKELLWHPIIESGGDKSSDIVALLEKHFPPKSIDKLKGAIDTALAGIIRKVELEGQMNVKYRNEVSMPGILAASNSQSVEGSTLMWDCSPNPYHDVVMTAESRSVNVWAMVVTAAVCLALLAGLILPIVRIKR